MSEGEPVSWRKPIILGICVVLLGLLLAGRAFFKEPPVDEKTVEIEVE